MSARPDDTPLDVAFDSGPLLGPLTGVGAAVAHIAEALDRRGDIEIHRYACSFRGSLPPGTTRLPLPAALAQRLWARTGRPRVDRWLRPADVVHGTNYVVAPSRLPRVVSVYDCWFLRNPGLARADVVRAGRVLRRAVATGAVVHASSQATAVAVRELLGAERVEVIALAALALRDEPVPPPPVAELVDVPFVLALGTLERRKNLPRLVSAFGRIAAIQPTLRLVLAGRDGDDRDEVDRAIDAMPVGARDRVLLTGPITPATKQWLLTEARVLAYPSLDEGFGFPLLEAMQHRVPVVASRAGAIPEVAGEAAVLVDADDVDGLAAALDRVLSDQPLRDRLIAAGQRRLTCYSWVDTAARLVELYRRLAAEAAG